MDVAVIGGDSLHSLEDIDDADRSLTKNVPTCRNLSSLDANVIGLSKRTPTPTSWSKREKLLRS